jgi:Fe/S biogenesis protein NfuA
VNSGLACDISYSYWLVGRYHPATMTNTTTTIVEITDNAREKILALRDGEGLDDLHLGLRITGVGPQGYVYETAFLRSEDVGSSDLIEDHDGLPVAIALDSVETLRGAVLDLSGDGTGPGLVMRNPNVPSPTLDSGDLGDLELTGTTEEKIRTLLNERINPAIASHGGIATLIKVEGTIAHLELGGGCQGCGLAAVTLRQGIERSILDAIPEIEEVVDVTDHAMGTNPFYA